MLDRRSSRYKARLRSAGRCSSSGPSRWSGVARRQRCGLGTVPWHRPCRCSVTVMNECANPLIIAHSGVQRGPLIKVRVLLLACPFHNTLSPFHSDPRRARRGLFGDQGARKCKPSYQGPLLKWNRQTHVKVSLLEREENYLCHVHRARRSLFCGPFTHSEVNRVVWLR
ncbi:hypothetical protein IRJ41_003373 [Triplophysa rosa]|uniref:Uncharacterized protein n=1 Tax=Triplophysa rosa TaxID=992332 RepID=A0A9W7WM61_TRIRA|nr:hypothetical protein IRJ41_003373 [Triplophysa rosa]